MTDFGLLSIMIVLVVYSNLVMKARAVVHADVYAVSSAYNYILALALDWWVWTAGVATAIAALLWLFVIRKMELSVAQPTLAITFVAVPLAAAAFLGEPLPLPRIAGLVLIVAGVILVTRTA